MGEKTQSVGKGITWNLSYAELIPGKLYELQRNGNSLCGISFPVYDSLETLIACVWGTETVDSIGRIYYSIPWMLLEEAVLAEEFVREHCYSNNTKISVADSIVSEISDPTKYRFLKVLTSSCLGWTWTVCDIEQVVESREP